MPLDKRVRVARRFQKSIRIDTDLKNAETLEGFVCSKSFSDVLTTMARHIGEKKQAAFTWTGPYGSGKSSLAVAFSALVNGNLSRHRRAEDVFGQSLSRTIARALPPGKKGWRIIPVVGRRDDPVRVIGDALLSEGIVRRSPRGGWTENSLLKALLETSQDDSKGYGGLVLFIDELGKFLEAAAYEGRDLHFFQQVAEIASRSNGRLVVIGILHQAFDEYAHRLSSQTRDEWAKIHGRYVDLAVDFSGEEQIFLLSQAIETKERKKAPGPAAATVAEIIRPTREADAKHFARLLESCWPLHPVVACLLGPISRRRFGQNQRSIFGFLNSTERHGFRDFLHNAGDNDLFTPNILWDYLRTNLEPSILASPDGHRWALAAEAIERCENLGGDDLQIRLLKSIAVIDLFKERSGLVPSYDLLRTCFPDHSESGLQRALSDLDSWSLTVFRKFVNAYAIYAGSDFDIEGALKVALADIEELDFTSVRPLAQIHPILAKRHYHETGALRWFDVNITSLSNLATVANEFSGTHGAVGQFLLVIPGPREDVRSAEGACIEIANNGHDWDNVVGISKRSAAVGSIAREVLAIDRVRNNHPALAGDAVARREVTLRLAALQAQLETEIGKAFDEAKWFSKNARPVVLGPWELNGLASDLADSRFEKSPRLHNELLNRQKPSGSAIAGQNALLRRMVMNQGESRLGIEGYPAEGGLFASVLEATGLYVNGPSGWTFSAPTKGKCDRSRLYPMWSAATSYIKSRRSQSVPVAEIYELWRKQPFGVKDGLLPILAAAFILSEQDSLAIYREGIFRARFDDVDVDYLAKDPKSIQLRWMDLSAISRKLLSDMAELVRTLDAENSLVHLEPIDVARGLVAIYDRLPRWTKRTMRLSANAIRVREMFQRARDPNRFLFDDLPKSVSSGKKQDTEKNLKQVVSQVQEGLEELIDAYPTMLSRLRETMLAELQVPNLSRQSVTELRDRASNIKNIAGDFRLDAFVGRLAEIENSQASFEGIASLVANKPSSDWVDLDVDRAAIEITDLSQKFLRVETLARVKGRKEKRHAFAVVVGSDNQPRPVMEEFQIADSERTSVSEVVAALDNALNSLGTKKRNVVLAALAELGMRLIDKKK